MFNFRFFVVLLSLVVVFGLGLAYKPCIDYPNAKVDVETIFAVKKFYVIDHSECTTCENDEDWRWITGRSIPSKICMTSNVKIRGESYTINLRCEYLKSDFGTQNCEIDSTNVKGEKKTGFKGVKKFAGTNNKTWWAVSVCAFGKEQWWIVVATEPTLPDADKKAALESLEKLGFDTKATKKGIIQFETFEFSQC